MKNRCQDAFPSCLHFLIDFCSQLGPPNPENSRPHCSESTIFLKSHFDVHMDFWFDFGANLAPFWLPKSSKILPKIDPKRHQFFDRFLDGFFIHFGSNLGPNLEPCWPLFRTKWRGALGCSPLFCCVGFFFGFFRAGPWGTPSDRGPNLTKRERKAFFK